MGEVHRKASEETYNNMIGNLAHIAIAVPDLDVAIHQYENTFGVFVTLPQDLPHHGVRVAMVKLPNTTIELITPLGAPSPLDNFLKKNPQGGLHHLCYEVKDINKARDAFIAAGLHVIGDGQSTLGYHGNPVLFFHPKDCLGTLIELEEVSPPKTSQPTERPIDVIHSPSHQDFDSLGGIEGIGITIEVDFKGKTPKDNEERE